MPKNVKLKTEAELAAIVKKQNEKDDGTGPIDWDLEVTIKELKEFFRGEEPVRVE
jgi:hypothetical protein